MSNALYDPYSYLPQRNPRRVEEEDPSLYEGTQGVYGPDGQRVDPRELYQQYEGPGYHPLDEEQLNELFRRQLDRRDAEEAEQEALWYERSQKAR